MGQLIMLGTLFGLISVIFGAVYCLDPEARGRPDPEAHGRPDPQARGRSSEERGR